MVSNILAVFDTDPVYARKLSSALEKKSLPLTVMAFTSEETLKKAAEKLPITLLLLPEGRKILPRVRQWAYLCEKRTGEKDRIYKYQGVSAIAEQILELLPVSYWKDRRESAELYGFYSPDAQFLGRETAERLAEICAGSKKTLLLSLEAFDGGGEGADLSDACYYFEEGKLPVKWAGLVSHKGPLDTLCPVKNPEDLWQITPELLYKLVAEIASFGLYRVIALSFGQNIGQCENLLPHLKRLVVPFFSEEAGKKRRDSFVAYAKRLCQEQETEVLLVEVPAAGQGSREEREKCLREVVEHEGL